MRLKTVTNISVDGVTQGHRWIEVAGTAEQEARGGFERFGWAPPLLDEEASEFIGRTFLGADAFLFGRRTYEIFAASWGAGMDPGHPVGQALNDRPKYVASATLTDPDWPGTTVLSGDVPDAVRALKAAPGGELQVWGSGTLIRTLLAHRLVDELVLLVYPVIVGQGTRLFPVTGPDLGLALTGLRSTPSGLTLQTYRATGPPRYERPTA
ncbi:dihydrofolate reductase family protein [Streptomyces thermospinosisporus]|uniref:Dihydrofolate reductase family protein n=1 Tax=Streptomyces thermospinosisporus TaxID=161482 RepID=A0ABN1Z316_9ACTN